MDITRHARKRLYQRFHIRKEKDILQFIKIVNNTGKYKECDRSKKETIVIFKDFPMKVIIRRNKIITVWFFEKRKKQRYNNKH